MKVAIQKKDNYPVLKDDYPENFRKLQERYQAAFEGEIDLYALFRFSMLQIYLLRIYHLLWNLILRKICR